MGHVGALTESELSQLRRKLLELKGELVDLLAATKEGARPVDLDEPIGRLSRMDAMQQQNMQLANRRAATLRQQQVAAALERMEEEEYGECLSCGESIDLGRLQVAPEAPFCVACQGRRERRS